MEVRGKNLPADERRAVTVAAVVELAGAQVPSEITTAAIAGHMKLTQGALFRHFPSKDAIWAAVMDWVAAHLIARIDEAASGKASSLAALAAIFDSHIAFVVQHPGVPRMMFGELQRAEPTPARQVAQSLMKQYARRLVEHIEKGQAAGEIRPDIDKQAAAILFIGTIQGLVMQSMLSGSIQRIRRDAPGVFEIYRYGLAMPVKNKG